MSTLSRTGAAPRRRGAARRQTLAAGAFGVLLLASCATARSAPAVSPSAAEGLAAASSGLCRARQALPDLVVAGAAFTNFAHDALHVLAADGRLERPLAAKVLETMATVEADLRGGIDEPTFARDLDALQVSTDEALRAINEMVPPCDR